MLKFIVLIFLIIIAFLIWRSYRIASFSGGADHSEADSTANMSVEKAENIINNITQKKLNDCIYNSIPNYTSYSKKQYSEDKYKLDFSKIISERLAIDYSKYKSFIDICSNPNTSAIVAMQSNPAMVGYGVSLQLDQGGYEANPKLDKYPNYKIKYYNLLRDDPKLLNDIPKVDFALADCFARHNKEAQRGNVTQIQKELQQRAFKIIFDKLNSGGDIRIAFPFMYDNIYLLNTITMLKENFENVIVHKDRDVTPDISVIFIYCKNYLGTTKSLDTFAGRKPIFSSIGDYEKNIIGEIYKVINEAIIIHI